MSRRLAAAEARGQRTEDQLALLSANLQVLMTALVPHAGPAQATTNEETAKGAPDANVTEPPADHRQPLEEDWS